MNGAQFLAEVIEPRQRLQQVVDVEDTLYLPPMQDEEIDLGEFVFNWRGPRDHDLLVIDSLMNCRIKLGKLVYGGGGAALRLRPRFPVPIDKIPVLTESVIQISTIATPSPFADPVDYGGIGIMFDSGVAPIVQNSLLVESVLNFHLGGWAPNPGHGAHGNNLHILHLHTNVPNTVLFMGGESFKWNWFKAVTRIDGGALGVQRIVCHPTNRLDVQNL